MVEIVTELAMPPSFAYYMAMENMYNLELLLATEDLYV
jgi:hypothetical protein